MFTALKRCTLREIWYTLCFDVFLWIVIHNYESLTCSSSTIRNHTDQISKAFSFAAHSKLILKVRQSWTLKVRSGTAHWPRALSMLELQSPDQRSLNINRQNLHFDKNFSFRRPHCTIRQWLRHCPSDTIPEWSCSVCSANWPFDDNRGCSCSLLRIPKDWMLSLQTALKLSPETLHSALRNHLAMIARSSQSGHKPHTVYIIPHCRISSKQHCIFFLGRCVFVRTPHTSVQENDLLRRFEKSQFETFKLSFDLFSRLNDVPYRR